MKAECKKSVIGDLEIEFFTEGVVYEQRNPEVWPTEKCDVCLRDNTDENHFMQWSFFHEHFDVVK